MTQTLNLNQIIPTAVAKSFEKRLEKELVIGKAARKEFKNGLKMGDEIDIIMPARTEMSDWDGGDLKTAQKIDSTIVKVKIDTGKQVNFELEAAKELQIQGSTPDVAAKLIDEYSSDARYQARNAIDAALGKLYPMAGLKIADSNGYNLTKDNFAQFLADMKAKFARANVFKSGQMSVYIPPEAAAVALGMSYKQYTESEVKDIKTGLLQTQAGWKIYESNNVYMDSNNIFYPLFTVDGMSFAAPIQKELNLIPYMRDESLNKAFKGGFVFGAGVPNANYLGYATWKIPTSTYA